MVKITKVYTRSGDSGTTGLVGGRRLPKDHPRIMAYGTVDELNSVLGIVLSFLLQKEETISRKKLGVILEAIQQKLFDMGSQLATLPGDEYKGQIYLKPEDTVWLEGIIDSMNEELQPLKSFILPGGTPLNSFLHLSRTVCRRAEREIIKLNQIDLVSPEIIKFINRLSDFLFVTGRWVTEKLGENEILWKPGKKNPDWNLK